MTTQVSNGYNISGTWNENPSGHPCPTERRQKPKSSGVVIGRVKALVGAHLELVSFVAFVAVPDPFGSEESTFRSKHAHAASPHASVVRGGRGGWRCALGRHRSARVQVMRVRLLLLRLLRVRITVAASAAGARLEDEQAARVAQALGKVGEALPLDARRRNSLLDRGAEGSFRSRRCRVLGLLSTSSVQGIPAGSSLLDGGGWERANGRCHHHVR